MAVAPKSIQAVAQRALDVRRELPMSKRAGTSVGVARARDIANGKDLSIDTLKRMKSFLARLGGNYKKARSQGKTIKDGGVILAYALWGGEGAIAWVDKELRKYANSQ